MYMRLIAAAGLALALAGPALADQPPNCDGPQNACMQIADIHKNYDAAFNSHDVATITGLLTPDAVVAGAGVMLSGRDALEKFYTAGFKAGWGGHASAPIEVHVKGDSGWAVGSWSALPPGAKQPVRGTWGNVYAHQGGAWKIRMSTWNITPAPAK